jgi:hypothetical protein
MPILRVDQEDIDLEDGEDLAKIKVRSWAAP